MAVRCRVVHKFCKSERIRQTIPENDSEGKVAAVKQTTRYKKSGKCIASVCRLPLQHNTLVSSAVSAAYCELACTESCERVASLLPVGDDIVIFTHTVSTQQLVTAQRIWLGLPQNCPSASNAWFQLKVLTKFTSKNPQNCPPPFGHSLFVIRL